MVLMVVVSFYWRFVGCFVLVGWLLWGLVILIIFWYKLFGVRFFFLVGILEIFYFVVFEGGKVFVVCWW